MSDFLPKEYRMDPLSDDLIYGSDLKNGMEVLIELDQFRSDLEFSDHSKRMEPTELSTALQMNRWCTVSKMAVEDGDVKFIGIYEDGRKISHRWDLAACWYVRLYSVPKEET